jgi:hypothetical protein
MERYSMDNEVRATGAMPSFEVLVNMFQRRTNIYDINNRLEEELADYLGSKYCVLIDNASNGIFLSLMYEGIKGKEITIPSHTYPSVPCEIIHAGGKVKFWKSPEKLKGAYRLIGSRCIDSALRFTHNMYVPGSFMVVSFTGPNKRFKLSKGGAILTDDKKAYKWFRRARYSGRRECSYFEDNFDMLGWNFMMMPEIAARGLMMIPQLYENGIPKEFEDIELPYPDLSKFKVYEG